MVFIEETEIDERGLRRLAESRGRMVTKNGAVWGIVGLSDVELSDDECWDMLSGMPQIYTLSGKRVPLS